MEVYIIRHGQSEANKAGVHAGWGQTPLSVLGTEQAEAVGKRLEGIHFDKVYVSDLLRTMQTACRAVPGYDYLPEPRIREFSSGELVGRKIADCRRELGEAYERALRENDYTAYGGENEDMVSERIESFMADLAEDEAAGAERVAAVSHEGAVRHMLYYVLGCKFSKARIRTDNCSVVKLECLNGAWRVCF